MLHSTIHNKEKINQSLKECTAWLAALNLLKDYSYAFKNTLSETLDTSTDRELIAEVENFHNLIIVRDEYIKDIAADVRLQQKKLNEASKNTDDKLWVRQQEKLRNEMTHLEKDFSVMKDNFNQKFFNRAAS